MYEVTKELRFEAAHRLLNYVGKCKNIHGHSYKARISMCSEQLQKGGFVIDFGTLKSIIGDWLDEWWDHAIILHEQDPILEALKGQDVKIYTTRQNPTAEYMAKHLYKITCANFVHREHLKVTAITIEETITSWATYTPDVKGE